MIEFLIAWQIIAALCYVSFRIGKRVGESDRKRLTKELSTEIILNNRMLERERWLMETNKKLRGQ